MGCASAYSLINLHSSGVRYEGGGNTLVIDHLEPGQKIMIGRQVFSEPGVHQICKQSRSCVNGFCTITEWDGKECVTYTTGEEQK